MNLKTITILLIISTFVLWIGWDIVLVILKENTISQYLQWFGNTNNWFVYLMGFLSGHWFFSRKTALTYGWIIALSFMALLGVIDLIWYLNKLPFVWYRYSPIWFIVGLIAGLYLWNQKDSNSPIN